VTLVVGAATATAGSFVFVSDRADQDGALYAINDDGTGLKRLATNASYPSWSPDGRRIAFIREDWVANFHLWVFDVSTGATTLVQRRAYGLAWSPDGRELLFVTDSERVIAMNMDTGVRRTLPRGFSDAEWSPDGMTIAYNGSDVWLMDSSGANPRKLVPGRSPRWSPDGTKIAFHRPVAHDGSSRYDFENLFVMNADGTHVVRFTPLPLRELSYSWSPTTGRLAYSGTLKGDGEVSTLKSVNADKTGEREILHPVAEFARPEWSPDGSRLAVERTSRDGVDDIWVVDPDTGAGTRVTKGHVFGGNNFWVQWDPLGGSTSRIHGSPSTHAIPTNSVARGSVVRTAGRVTHLSADGGRVAFGLWPTAESCSHPEVWDTTASTLTAFWCGGPTPWNELPVAGLAVAGERVTWYDGDYFFTGSIARPVPLVVRTGDGVVTGAGLLGDAPATVFVSRPVRYYSHGDASYGPPTIWRVVGRTAREVVTSPDRLVPLALADGRVAVQEPGDLRVIRLDGRTIATFPFAPSEIRGAALDGNRLIVLRGHAIEAYDIASRLKIRRIELDSRLAEARLVDGDRHRAALIAGRSIWVVRLGGGPTLVLRPRGEGRVFAQIEGRRLYYAFSRARGIPKGRVVLRRLR